MKEDASQLRLRFTAVLQRMGYEVMAEDPHGYSLKLFGFRTLGKGAEAPTVFRFLDRPTGLAVGWKLTASKDSQIWKVTATEDEKSSGTYLFFTAYVEPWSERPVEEPVDPSSALAKLRELAGPQGLLDDALESDDILEALGRIEDLAQGLPRLGLSQRLEDRLALIRRIMLPKDSAGQARPAILKLEAVLRRGGWLQ